ncbi:MAG: FAD-binding oxidoreductase [Kiloniellales bacterium]
MTDTLFTEDFKTTSYWWDRCPREAEAEPALPNAVEVAVIGSGYTGLHAALQIARGGRQVLVLDAEAAGWGCSSRNGGQISSSVKPSYAELSRRHGAETARRLLEEGVDSLAFTGDFIRQENLDCDFKVVGRFHAAHNPKAFQGLVAGLESKPDWLDAPGFIVPRSEQQAEIGSEIYHGGLVLERHAAVDPGRYHQGLLALARAAGVEVAAFTPVSAIQRDGQGYLLATERGRVAAKQVVLATNGYSGPLSPWHQRRVIPIGSYMIATEPLAPGVMDRLLPKNRVTSDTRRVVYYYRASPDRQRILFGGRVSAGETDPKVSGPHLHASMTRIFPELAKTRISHSWMGFVAYTFDHLAHMGEKDGLYYAMGYCGSGVGMASYLGMRLGQKVLGKEKGETAFSSPGFQTRPLYRGKPWFLPATVAYYRWRDG